MTSGALPSIEAALASGDDPDDTLRAVVAELARQPEILWAGIFFLEDGVLSLGPEAGDADPGQRTTSPVSYQGTMVGELAVDGSAEPSVLEELCALIATHVLLGWDTGGEVWDP